MEARVNLIILICLSVSISVGFSQEAPTSEPAAAEVKTPSFPYVAEITADDVYCRSGPGTNYYPCGKFKKGDRVTVVGSQFSWSRIVPPAGSFSWISAQYVKVDPNRPIIGTVTGNAVRVYVGSDYVDLMRSTRPELKLNVGEKVKLMGEPNSGYYKIAPPGGGYRWVSTTYAKPVAPVSERPTAPPPRPVAREVVVPTRISGEAGNLKQYYALERQMRAERSRPIAQQDYRNIRRALLEIARNEQAGGLNWPGRSIKQSGFRTPSYSGPTKT
ncbi:MAG: SH3 domain-containing protein [Planctomycetota bacterium]